jgi:Flp pilus assembly protein TadG
MTAKREAGMGIGCRLRAFRRDSRGGIAVQFAFLALPVTVLAFGMIDINRASVGKKDLQDALDAATLIAARSTAITDAELQTVGSQALAGQLSGQMGDATLISSSFKADESKVNSSASIKLTPIVANLWLKGDMTVGAKSEVVRSMNKLEVAMVLDTTGSMAGSRLTNLKLAATDFIDQLAAAAARSTEPNPVKIGIVPFSSAVRIAGTSTEVNTYKSASWIDGEGNAPASQQIFWSNDAGNLGFKTNRFSLLSGMGQTWGGCIESREAPYDIQDTAPTASTPETLFTPYFWPDEADNDSSSVNSYLSDGASASWNWQRRQGNVGKYTTSPAGSGKGPNRGCDMQAISRLSTNWTALKSKVNALNAAGETHIPLGMAWGWHLLSPNSPFSDGVPYSTPKLTKVVVLMTDGDNVYNVTNSNNRSNYDGYAFIWQNRSTTTSNTSSTRRAAQDDRFLKICKNMKDAGIVIYAVGLQISATSGALLQNCATTSDKYYSVTSAGNLTAAFSAIAGSIQNLRISG